MVKKNLQYNLFMVMAIFMTLIAGYNMLLDKVDYTALCFGAIAILISFAHEFRLKELEEK